MKIDNFGIIPNEIWADRRLTLEQMRVIGALFSLKKKNLDIVCASRQEISERCGGVHISNISKSTTALEKLGWLHKTGDGGRSSHSEYRLSIPVKKEN